MQTPKLTTLLILLTIFNSGCAVSSQQKASAMQQDQASVRAYYDNWMRATIEGLPELGMSLVDESAVFLMPGAPPMDRETFVNAATAGDPNNSPIDYDLKSEVHEIKVIGDYAWLWTEFKLVSKHKETGDTSTVAGHTLSILKRSGDSWVAVREANTMSQVPND